MAVGNISRFFDVLYPEERNGAIYEKRIATEIFYYKNSSEAVIVDRCNNLHVRIWNVSLSNKHKIKLHIVRIARAVHELYYAVKVDGLFNSFWVDICNLSEINEETLLKIVPNTLINPIFPPLVKNPVIVEEDESGTVDVGFVSFLPEKSLHFWQWTKRGQPCAISNRFIDCSEKYMCIGNFLPRIYQGRHSGRAGRALTYYFNEVKKPEAALFKKIIENEIERQEKIYGKDSMQMRQIIDYKNSCGTDYPKLKKFLEEFEG